MRQYLKIPAVIFVLSIMAFVVYRWQGMVLDAVAAYRSPLRNSSLEAGERVPAQTERVVLVIISGLTKQAAESMTTFHQLQETGAAAVLVSQPPSYREPAWATLASGAGPALNDAPLLDFWGAQQRLIHVDTIFSVAQQYGLGTALAGNPLWQAMVPAGQLDRTAFTTTGDEEGDQKLLAQVLVWLEKKDLKLIVLQFDQVDRAGKMGTATEAYQTAVQQVDALLATLEKALNLETATLIVTSDYGYTGFGGHGGADGEVLHKPFVMVGHNVIPGKYSPIEQRNVAPTIAALLGLRFPSINQGRPLTEMLNMSPDSLAATMVALAKQRLQLAQVYATALNNSFAIREDATKMSVFLDRQNYSGAAQLAQLLLNEADESMAQVQATKQASERRGRLLLATGVLVGLLLLAVWRRTDLWVEVLFSAGGSVGAYHLLYRASKLPYSLSAIVNVNQALLEAMQRMALSMLAGSLIFLVLLLLRQYTNLKGILQSSYELSLYAVIGFLIPALYGYWKIGGVASNTFPDVSVFFYYITGLWQTFWAIVIGLFVPPGVILLNFVLQKGIALYQNRYVFKLRIM